jgi:hypothetical protein
MNKSIIFGPGMPRDAQRCPGVPSDAQGCPGMPRDGKLRSKCYLIESLCVDFFGAGKGGSTLGKISGGKCMKNVRKT